MDETTIAALNIRRSECEHEDTLVEFIYLEESPDPDGTDPVTSMSTGTGCSVFEAKKRLSTPCET